MKYRLFDVDIMSTVSFCFQHETRGSGSGSNEYDLAAVVVHHGSGYVFLNILMNVLWNYFYRFCNKLSVHNDFGVNWKLTFPFHKHFFFIVKKFKTYFLNFQETFHFIVKSFNLLLFYTFRAGSGHYTSYARHEGRDPRSYLT